MAVRFYARRALSNFPIPRVTVDWVNDTHVYVDLSFGDGNSDPVVCVGVDMLRVPGWLRKRLP